MPPTTDDLPPDQLFLKYLPFIQRVIDHSCRRYHLSREEAEDFAQTVKLKIIKDDYAVIRKFKGESTFETYLTMVVKRALLDYIDHLWGKWRSSEEAKRLGPVAEQLEKLLRDGYSFEETCSLLLTNYRLEMTREELDDLRMKLPRRIPRQMKGEEELNDMPDAGANPQDEALQREKAARRQEVEAKLKRALATLAAEDQVVIRMWMDGFKVVEIAKSLHLDQKALYRRIERILKDLRKALKDEGVGPEDIDGLL